MDSEVEQFINLWKLKSEAKQRALVAIGQANFLVANEQDATAAIEEARVNGRAEGAEGQYYAEAFALAESYVAANPKRFISFEDFVDSDDPKKHDALVALITALNKAGDIESATRLTMFELVRFERQQFGGTMKILVRQPYHGS